MMGGIYGQDLSIAEVIKRLYDSSATLACTNPGIACRTLDIVPDASLGLSTKLILFQL